MRLGIWEIAIIIIVLIAIAISARMLRANPDSAEGSDDSSAELIKRRVNERTRRRWRRLRRVGIALILTGAVLLFTSIGLFRWAFQSYAWSLIMVVIGLAMVFLSRKK